MTQPPQNEPPNKSNSTPLAQTSKALQTSDLSGFDFVQEILKGDPTFAINFDRLQFDSVDQHYIIFELLLCEEWQGTRGITPYTSHPNKYWHKNSQKFLALWRATQKLEATLFLVNYAKANTKYADEVLIIKVLEMTDKGITKEETNRSNRAKFAEWFRKMNKRASGKAN